MDVAVGLALAVGGALGLAEGLLLGECPVLRGVAGTAEGSSGGTGTLVAALVVLVVAGAEVLGATLGLGAAGLSAQDSSRWLSRMRALGERAA